MAAQIECAMLFTGSGQSGIILEIQRGQSFMQQYFNASCFSAYGSEDERLFFGGHHPSKFASIRVLNNFNKWNNFKFYIHSLAQLHEIITGRFQEASTHLISTGNIHIIKELITNKGNESNSYITEVFKSFTKKLTTITIDVYSDAYYKFPFSSEFYCQLFLYPTENKTSMLYSYDME